MIDNLTEAISHAREVAEEIHKTNEEMPTDCKLSEDLCKCASEHEQIAAWLTELQERREADKWIPVSERMPECNGNYLAITNYGTRIVHFSRDKDRPYSIQFDTLEKVYYWKPLPKAPESEVENE